MLGATGLSSFADGVVAVGLPLAVLGYTSNPSVVAGVFVATRLPWLVLVLQLGVLADRYSRRQLLVISSVSRTVLLAVLGTALWIGFGDVWAVFVIAFLFGAGDVMFDTTAQALVPRLVDKPSLARANSRLYATELITNRFLGPPLGGALAGLAAGGLAGAFWGCSLGYALATLGLSRVPADEPTRSAAHDRMSTAVAEGLRHLLGSPVLRRLAALTAITNFASSTFFALIPAFALQQLGLSGLGYSMLLVVIAVGGLAGTAVGSRLIRRWGRAACLRACILYIAVFLAAAGLLPEVAVVSVGLVGFGAAVVLWNVITVSLRQEITPDAVLGRVNSAYRLLSWGAMPLGAAAAALVQPAIGIGPTWVAAAGLLVAQLVLSPADRAMDEAAGAPALTADPQP